MESVFSVRPLEALLDAGHDVRFVMRPIGGVETRKKPIVKRHRGFDVAVKKALGLTNTLEDAKRNPFIVAAARDVPAYVAGDASCPQAVELVRKEKVDVIVVAFFNQLLRPSLFQAAPLGAVNLHPSLLPRYRGPAPLFWTFRDGVAETGLTLHRIAAGEDNGDVLLQETVPIPFGMPGEDLVDELAARASRMTTTALEELVAGRIAGRTQDEAKATRAPRPTAPDLIIDPSMGAERIFTFARGVGRWNQLVAEVGGGAGGVSGRVRVVDAVEVDTSRRIPGETALVGDLLHIGCDDGIVVLQTRAQPV